MLVKATDQSGQLGGARTGRPQLTAEEARQLTALKDILLGHLENGPAEVQVGGKNVSGMDVAADGFAQLAVRLPAERLPKQNLAIARLLLLKDAQENLAGRRTQAREAASSCWISTRSRAWPIGSRPVWN